jgi:hypothetical protein
MSSLQIFYSTIVITIELTVKTYPYLKWQWVFYFLRRCFLSSITAKTFTGLDCLARRVSYEKWLHLGFVVGSMLLICLVIYVVLLCVFTFLVPLRFPHKTMFGSPLPPVVWGELMSYCVLCVWLCIHIDVQHFAVAHLFSFQYFVFCFVCLRPVANFSGLSIFDPFGFL